MGFFILPAYVQILDSAILSINWLSKVIRACSVFHNFVMWLVQKTRDLITCVSRASSSLRNFNVSSHWPMIMQSFILLVAVVTLVFRHSFKDCTNGNIVSLISSTYFVWFSELKAWNHLEIKNFNPAKGPFSKLWT